MRRLGRILGYLGQNEAELRGQNDFIPWKRGVSL